MPLLQISLREQGRALTRPRRGPLALRLAPFSGPARPVSARLRSIVESVKASRGSPSSEQRDYVVHSEDGGRYRARQIARWVSSGLQWSCMVYAFCVLERSGTTP